MLENQHYIKRKQSEVKKEKELIFSKIAGIFGTNRTAAQVAKCYGNMRTRAIEKERNNKNQLKQKGGGVAELKKLDPWEEKILTFNRMSANGKKAKNW